MAAMWTVVLLGLMVAVTSAQVFKRPDDCAPCDPSLCDEAAVAKCGAGTVKDR